MPWAWLWPFCKGALSTEQKSNVIDTDTLIHRIALGKPVREIPFLCHEYLSPCCKIVLDFSQSIIPLWEDLREIKQSIENLRGTLGIELYCLNNSVFELYDKPLKQKKDFFNFSDSTIPIFVISDMGFYDADRQKMEKWKELGTYCLKRGIKPVALVPVPPSYWDKAMLKIWNVFYWDRATVLPQRPAESCGRIQKPENRDEVAQVEELLTYLSPAIWVEPDLLRCVRMKLMPLHSSVETEVKVWKHPDVWAFRNGFSFKPRKSREARNGFKGLTAGEQIMAMTCIRNHHAAAYPSVYNEEWLAYVSLVGERSDAYGPFKEDIKDAKQYSKRMARTFYDGALKNDFFFKQWMDFLSDRQMEDIWKNNPALCAAYTFANREKLKKDKEIELPYGLSKSLIDPYLDMDTVTKRLFLRHTWQGWSFDKGSGVGPSPQPEGSTVALVKTNTNSIEMTCTDGGEPKTRVIELQQNSTFKTPGKGIVKFGTGLETIELETFTKPLWATGIGRDQNSLFVDITEGNMKRRLHWFNPGAYPVQTDKGSVDIIIPKGFWWDENEYLDWQAKGFVKPVWADEFGVDVKGMFAGFTIKGIATQYMRWIWPGEFDMGSPENEPERSDDEKQHAVILTKGYWLAETACTQALWKAVMRDVKDKEGKPLVDPSSFKGDLNPVDGVSWGDCKLFFEKIDKIKPGLILRLPTEAEWEYACRAGTTTPFSFGENITTELVNYDGNYPYNNGNKGEYRGKTVAVKSFPANQWGLFEMHGNVWEWCEDWYNGDYYKGSPIIDPLCLDTGVGRVLRGGSWDFDGGWCRSAYRDRWNPDWRLYSSGFRFAQGQNTKQGPVRTSKPKKEPIPEIPSPVAKDERKKRRYGGMGSFFGARK